MCIMLACSQYSINIINNVNYTCNNNNNINVAAMDVSDQKSKSRTLFGTPVRSSTNPLYL